MGLESGECTGLAMPVALNDDYSVVGHINLVGGGSALWWGFAMLVCTNIWVSCTCQKKIHINAMTSFPTGPLCSDQVVIVILFTYQWF